MQDEAKPTWDKPWGSDGLAEGEPPPRPHLLRWFDVGFVWGFFFTFVCLCLLLLSFYNVFCSVIVVTVVVLGVFVELLLMLLFILIGTVDSFCCSLVVFLLLFVVCCQTVNANITQQDSHHQPKVWSKASAWGMFCYCFNVVVVTILGWLLFLLWLANMVTC